MSSEFNYRRAWDQYVRPEFETLYPEIKPAYEMLKARINSIHQDGSRHAVTGVTLDLKYEFDKINSEILAKAAEVVYYYGHLAYNEEAQEGGLYWKFQIIAHTNLIERDGGNSEAMYKAKQEIDQGLESFHHDHIEGTSYDDDEVVPFINRISWYLGNDDNVQMLKVTRVNHKPDIFCIGEAHMRLSKGMYLDPTVAPCARCKMPYADHKSDRVMICRMLTEDQEKVRLTLISIKDFLDSWGIPIDGFAFTK